MHQRQTQLASKPCAGMSELDLANGGSGSGSGDDSPRPATRGGWEGGHALTQQGEHATTTWLVAECTDRQHSVQCSCYWLHCRSNRQSAAGHAWPIPILLAAQPPAHLCLPLFALRHAAPAAGAPGADAARPAVDETADKLDSMMELTFQHLERRGAAGQLGAAWDTLLGAFERSVLLTHRSKFTQVRRLRACLLASLLCWALLRQGWRAVALAAGAACSAPSLVLLQVSCPFTPSANFLYSTHPPHRSSCCSTPAASSRSSAAEPSCTSCWRG